MTHTHQYTYIPRDWAGDHDEIVPEHFECQCGKWGSSGLDARYEHEACKGEYEYELKRDAS